MCSLWARAHLCGRPQVPLKVSLSAGRSWGHLVPLQEAPGPRLGPRPPESPSNHPASAGPPGPPPAHFPPSFGLEPRATAEDRTGF